MRVDGIRRHTKTLESIAVIVDAQATDHTGQRDKDLEAAAVTVRIAVKQLTRWVERADPRTGLDTS